MRFSSSSDFRNLRFGPKKPVLRKLSEHLFGVFGNLTGEDARPTLWGLGRTDAADSEVSEGNFGIWF
jgi:hypothetical protein